MVFEALRGILMMVSPDDLLPAEESAILAALRRPNMKSVLTISPHSLNVVDAWELLAVLRPVAERVHALPLPAAWLDTTPQFIQQLAGRNVGQFAAQHISQQGLPAI